MSEHKSDPVVVDGVLQYTSVSAMALYETCPTKWYFRYVERLPGDTAPVLDFGIAAHERLERCQRGEPVTLLSTELAVLPYLPPMNRADKVEQSLSDGMPLLLGSIPIHGYADRIDLDATRALITDWKFKGDIAKWAAKPAALTDPKQADGRQLLAAAKWVLENTGNIETVILRHVTSQTGGIDDLGNPRGPFRVVETRGEPLSRAQVNERWDTVVADFEQPLLAAARATGPEQLPGLTKNCFKYGRPCLYLDRCPHKRKKEQTAMLYKIPDMPPVLEPTPTPKPEIPGYTDNTITFFFGGSYPMREKADTLHEFVMTVEVAAVRAALGDKYDPLKHWDIRSIDHPALNFGKWKAALAAAALKTPLLPGKYLVHNEERVQTIAHALVPFVRAIGGPNP
jgi:PD-(D/E)XK nuclease superfamily